MKDEFGGFNGWNLSCNEKHDDIPCNDVQVLIIKDVGACAVVIDR